MIFDPKTITLKDGTNALLRSPAPEDAAAMAEFITAAREETDFLLASPADSPVTLEAERQWIENSLRSPDELMIVCEINGQVAGNCQINFKSQHKVRHRAELAIGLRQKYWGNGIGTALFTELIAAARERGVTQLELTYVEGNDRGRALYEKMGFVPWGEQPDGVRQLDGTYRSLIHMRLVLE